MAKLAFDKRTKAKFPDQSLYAELLKAIRNLTYEETIVVQGANRNLVNTLRRVIHYYKFNYSNEAPRQRIIHNAEKAFTEKKGQIHNLKEVTLWRN